MANYTVSATQLTHGEIILVRGRLGFARLTRLIEGDELAKVDARQLQLGLSEIGVPHVTATLTQAEVLFADPANPTRGEIFVAERRFTSQKRPETGQNWSINSRGQTLPVIAIPTDDGKFIQDNSGKELAKDLDVTLVVRAYKTARANLGLGLDQVIVNEPVRYYAGSSNTEALAARGIVFAAPPQAVRADQATASGPAAGIEDGPLADPSTGTVIDESGFALPGPAAVTHVVPAAQPAPVAQAAPSAQTAQTAVQAETLEQKVARLEAENSAMKDAGSAVGANPWADEAQDTGAGITYQV